MSTSLLRLVLEYFKDKDDLPRDILPNNLVHSINILKLNEEINSKPINLKTIDNLNIKTAEVYNRMQNDLDTKLNTHNVFNRDRHDQYNRYNPYISSIHHTGAFDSGPSRRRPLPSYISSIPPPNRRKSRRQRKRKSKQKKRKSKQRKRKKI